MEDLIVGVKRLIVDTLNLEDLDIVDIENEAPLFGDGLGLDSIDALELGLAVKNKFGVVLSADSEQTRASFYSVATIAAMIKAHQG